MPSQLKEMLVHIHDAPTGVNKTLEQLRQQCFWHGMSWDVQVCITSCAECNQNNRLQANPRALLQCYQARNPGDRVHMDILGVQDAATVAQAFFKSYTVRFGCHLLSTQTKARIAGECEDMHNTLQA